MKLTAAETVYTALVGGYNAPRLNGYGAIRAGKSPATADIINALDPTRCEGYFSKNVSGQPLVKIDYFLEQNITPKTAFDCAPSAKGTPATTQFAITKYLQDGISFNSKEFETLYCDVDKFLSSQYAGMDISDPELKMYMRDFKAIGQLKQQFQTRINSAFLAPMENYALTKLAPGYNPVDATNTQVNIVMKKNDMFTTQILEKISALKLETGYNGQYIAIGGTQWGQWFGGECGLPNNITCCSQIGINFQAVRDNLPFEFYHSRFIDAMYGAGSLILIEEGSFGIFNWIEKLYGRPDGQYAGTESYGTIAFNLGAACEPSMTMTLDNWNVEKGLCVNGGNGVSLDVFWGSTYDVWAKPISFTHALAPLNAQTGIYHFKWTEI